MKLGQSKLKIKFNKNTYKKNPQNVVSPLLI